MAARSKICALILIGAFALGCAGSLTPRGGLLSRLSGRGPAALSADNPYLVGNLVLAREMAKSPVLRGFIAHRGTPSAVEVKPISFGSYQLLLYYIAQQEEFTFEELSSKWIIDGPKMIPAQKLSAITAIAQGPQGRAQLLSGRALSVAIGEEIVESTPVPEEVVALSPQPVAPTATVAPPQKLGFTSGPPTSSSSADTTTQSAALLNHSQLGDSEIAAKIQSKGAPAAEITAKGDLVHYVTLPGETLTLIARWYTFDRSNAGRLARINGIKDPGTISVGDIIVVPAYLARNKSRLTQVAIDALNSAPPPAIPTTTR